MTVRHFIRSATFILVITCIIAAALTYANPTHWLEILIASLVFTACIGLSIEAISTLLANQLERLSPVRRVAALFFIFLVAGFAGTEVGYVILRYTYFGELDLGSHFRLLLFNLVLATIFGSVAAVYFSLQRAAARMARRLKEKEINEERLERLRALAELDALQAKINPHFLFNTLNSIASLISENPAAAESTVEKLSELFRYTLQRSGEREVKLSEELEIVRSYLEIEKLRFGDRLQFDIRSDPRLDEFSLPALLIQPLVENSIKHGIASDPRGGRVSVETRSLNGGCVITVRDSGKGFAGAVEETGFGLKSIRERLNLAFDGRASLAIHTEGETVIEISLPHP